MRDPHVISLTYLAVPSDTVSFDSAPPLAGRVGPFTILLADGKLKIEPDIHFREIEEARKLVEPLLRSWEIDIALRYGSPELSFKYETAELIDRNPPPPGSPVTLQLQTGEMVSLGMRVTLHVGRGKYPDPPLTFRTNPEVETLWHRYEQYGRGQEPLPSMAFFCLTLLEEIAGSRAQAAKQFGISQPVLNKMGELTSTRGDASSARKYGAVATGGPLIGPEVRWLEEAVRAIIRRVGEVNSAVTLTTIALNDLPPLQSE
jgi:hypothetical protein